MSRRFNRLAAPAVVFSLLLVSGCSLFAPHTQPVLISTNEPEAEITVDGAKLGKGAVTVELQRNKTHAVMAKHGDRTAFATIGKSVSTTGYLDILGGIFFLIPFIGLAAPGFWSLDSDSVLLQL
jgi:hypothetical protein